jgi:hypothetical protein
LVVPVPRDMNGAVAFASLTGPAESEAVYLASCLGRVTPMTFTTRNGLDVEDYDWTYRHFVRRCVWLRGHVPETLGTLLTPREIDKILLMIADGVPAAINGDE